MNTAPVHCFVEEAIAQIELAIALTEQQLPWFLQYVLSVKKRQHSVNPWDDLKWEYEVRAEYDPTVAALLVDLTQLGKAYSCLKTMLQVDAHKNVPSEQLDLRLAKTRRLQ